MPTDKEFEDFFREQLNGLEEAPPPMAWEGIKEEVNSRRNFKGWLASATAIFLIGITAFFALRQPENLQNTKPASAPNAKVVKTAELAAPEINSPVPQPDTTPKEQVGPLKKELVVPGTERNAVYKTYLAMQQNAASTKPENPALEASVNSVKRSRPMAEVSTAAQLAENAAMSQNEQKQEALKIAEETAYTLAAVQETKATQNAVNQPAKRTKELEEAITETFGAQNYPEAVADTVENMVMVVPYTVPVKQRSWFSRFTGNFRRIFSAGK